MKLPASDISTESSKVLLEESFGVGNIGLIFEILRNKMYKNPIMAIAREISCNARDAHREVGKQATPIEIHLPNAFAPQYKVRDFGPGISPERMSKVFIQYATSTKREDNFQTGGFGLGAKTPFSYADTFTIVTITDGTKRTYHAYIDESRVGKMSLVSEEKTDEPAGTTIVIPVAKKDFREFIDGTITSTEFWDVKPKLLGVNPTPEYKNLSLLYSGSGWSLYSRKNVSSYSGFGSNYGYQNNRSESYAIIDGIGYAIESDSLAKLSGFHKNLLTNPFHFYFGNGELSLSASRDSIHYDEKTQKAIIDRIGVLASEIIKIINDKIQNCATYKEACQLYSVTLQQFNNSSQLETELRSTKLWKGFKLVLSPKATDVGKWAKLTTYKRDRGGKIRAQHWSYDISYDDKIRIYHNDKTQESVPKKFINHIFAADLNLQQVQVVSTPKEPTIMEYQNLVKQGKAPPIEYDMEFLKIIGAQPLSTIVIPKIKKPRKKREVSSGKISAYSLSVVSNKLHCTITEVDNDGGVYVDVDYKTKVYKSGDLVLKEGHKLNLINEFLGKTVYGFSDTRVKKLYSKWIPLDKAIANRIAELGSEISEQDILDNCANSNWLFQYIYDNLFSLRTMTKQIKSEKSLFAEFMQESQKVEQIISKYRPFIYILQMTKNIDGPTSDKYIRDSAKHTNCKLYKLQKAAKERYDLLDLISAHSPDQLAKVINYINLVDESYEKTVNVVELKQAI